VDLTLKMLIDPDMDFQKFNTQAGINHVPRVRAIVMTHCGWNRQKPNNPDSSTRFFIEQALNVAEGYSRVFSESDISKCFYLLHDFHSSGRISGNQKIPLAKLVSGKKYIVEGQRLEVNPPLIAISAKWPISRPRSNERGRQLRRPYCLDFC
jgi:chromosome partitioning protein